MMKKVGVTGNMGSGKTTVCKIFASLHIPIFNADQEAKSLYRREDVKKLIRKAFGDHLFDAQGALMLTGFADLIFNDKEALALTAKIIHPFVFELFEAFQMKHPHQPYVIFESAIIFENKLESHFDAIIMVSADESVRKSRIKQRDQLNDIQIRQRMANQTDQAIKIAQSDFCIHNNGEQALIPQVMAIHRQFGLIG